MNKHAKITIRPLSKINLTLDVGGKRSDGYHDLDSIVQTIDLSDNLRVELSSAEGIRVSVENAPDVPNDENNIVYKAASAFAAYTSIEVSAQFFIEKLVPSQAGLGGGSADSAAAIGALDRLYETSLSQSDLEQIALQTGSDSGVFVGCGTVRMSGRGDTLLRLPGAPVCIVKPSCGVSTGWAYNKLDERNRDTGKATEKMIDALGSGDIQKICAVMSNDFDDVITQSHAPVAEVKKLLMAQGAIKTMLCGSGSAVFGVFSTREESQMAAEYLKAQGHECYVTKSAFGRE